MKDVKVLDQFITDKAALYNGDSCEVLRAIPDKSIGYSIFSPPFADLYTYSNSDRDLGNVSDYGMFFEQFRFIIKELYRVLKPGRSVSFHCMNIPAMKERDGYIGLKDFRGDLIREFQKAGFIYHGEVTIWKDPLIEATRTKALGLMHKQLRKDSYICRQGLPDYVITMRKKGENLEPIYHGEGLKEYYGKDEPLEPKYINGEFNVKYSHLVWQKYASPVWMDIRQTYTLNKNKAREEQDEKHICPLQIDTVARCILLWSNPDDIILSPFGGIGTEPYVALKLNRRAIAIELKQSYYLQAVEFCREVTEAPPQMSLFEFEQEKEDSP